MTNKEMAISLYSLREMARLAAKYDLKSGELRTKAENDIEALTHAIELLEAEEKGELVGLPCPIGTKVYTLGWLKASAYFTAHINDEGNIIPSDVDLSDDEYGVLETEFEVSNYDEWGISVFPTREEAAEKLEGMK